MKHNFSTKLIHQGESQAQAGRSIIAPIYRTSTYEMGDEKVYQEILYGRLNNSPAHKALHEKLASIEGAEAALTFASGMAAISAALMAMTEAGDHVLVQKCLYGGTHGFLTAEAERVGFTYSFFDPEKPETWQVQDNTKLIYIESISNPLLEVPDIEAVVSFAKKHGLKTMIDNTFASPYNFRPAEHGIDVSVHSATKYINGHTDVLAGCVMANKEDIAKMQGKLALYGGCLDPQAVFLLNRGLKTLSLRMQKQNENSLELAKFLKTQKEVKKVFHPGLEDSPYFVRASKYYDGFGGVVSFEVESVEKAKNVIRKLQLPAEAPSLGGVESLVVIPAQSSHAFLTDEELDAMGLSKSLIRVSVGIEDIEDLIEDFKQALRK